MMRVSFRRNITQSFMVTQAQEKDCTEPYALKMVLKNDIEGFIRPYCEEMDAAISLVYDISSMYSLNTAFEQRRMSFSDLSLLLDSLKECVREMNEYLLDTGFLMLDPEYIFTDYNCESFYFCICPYISQEENSIRLLADMIISCIDYDDPELVKAAYEINLAMNNDNFSLEDIPAMIREGDIKENGYPDAKIMFADAEPVKENVCGSSCQNFREPEEKETVFRKLFRIISDII